MLFNPSCYINDLPHLEGYRNPGMVQQASGRHADVEFLQTTFLENSSNLKQLEILCKTALW